MFSMDYLHLFMYIIVLMTSFGLREIQAKEYCIEDTFKAQCPENSVVVMTNATYGRMHVGKCILDAIQMGCQTNILHVADRLCSGKRECELPNYLPEILELNPCRRGLGVYIEASYTCVKVTSTTECIVTDKEDGGHIHDLSTTCGAERTPWVIQSVPGRCIKITLFDFTYSKDIHSSSCQTIAFVKEDVIRSNKTICSGISKRISEIYTSVSNEVMIVISAKQERTNEGHFLLKYQFMGCPDPIVQGDAWYKRDGDKVEVGCRGSDTKWDLECIDNQWTGEFQNCSETGAHDNQIEVTKPEDEMNTGLPENTIVILIISISVLISVIVLIMGIVYALKRKRHNKPPSHIDHTTLPLTKDAIYTHNKKYQVPLNPQANIGTLYTNKPVYHASTCKRSQYQHMPHDTWNKSHPNNTAGTLRSESASWKYQNPEQCKDKLNNAADYESPYEQRAPQPHTYSPLGSEMRPPAIHEI